MNLPLSDSLSTQRLSRIFDKTVATYKYYWFLSILDLHVKHGRTRINVWEIMVDMVAYAWFPVTYFRLSFGKSESLYQAIWNLQEQYRIPINLNVSELEKCLSDLLNDSGVRKQLNFLQVNVPYRFLRPWIDTSDDREMLQRSQSFENGCLYKLERVDGSLWVEFNPSWSDYLTQNYCILRDFTYWNLTMFLQVRNPNVPNIPNKLVRCENRSSLSRQRDFWNTVIQNTHQVHCIYTDRLLEVNDYDLDHFIPWSFVSHDLLWNLMPADPRINCSKNNRLPSLDEYLPKLALAHREALVVYLQSGKKGKILEDYLSVGCTADAIVAMDTEHLLDCFRKTFVPLNQIAINMGFESWHYGEH